MQSFAMKVIYAYQYPLLAMACLLVPIVPGSWAGGGCQHTPVYILQWDHHTQEEWAVLENTDSVMQTSYPSPAIFNVSTYNSTNIGRYVNQGGLIESIRKMVEVSSRVFPVPDWKVVRRLQKYIVMLSTSAAGGIGLVIELKQDMVLTGQTQELYANYSIERWVPVAELGTGNECVHAILWCGACSCDSNWSQRDREAVHFNLRRHGRQMSLPTCPAHGQFQACTKHRGSLDRIYSGQ